MTKDGHADALRAVGRILDSAHAAAAELRICDRLLTLTYTDRDGSLHHELHRIAELTLSRGWGDRLRSRGGAAPAEGWGRRLGTLGQTLDASRLELARVVMDPEAVEVFGYLAGQPVHWRCAEPELDELTVRRQARGTRRWQAA